MASNSFRRCVSFVLLQRRNFPQGALGIGAMDGLAVMSQRLRGESFRATRHLGTWKYRVAVQRDSTPRRKGAGAQRKVRGYDGLNIALSAATLLPVKVGNFQFLAPDAYQGDMAMETGGNFGVRSRPQNGIFFRGPWPPFAWIAFTQTQPQASVLHA